MGTWLQTRSLSQMGAGLISVLLLVACALHGAWTTTSLLLPPDIDTYRDIAVAQGFLDGNWWGDPTTPGAPRYYPPLVPLLYLASARLLAAGDLPAFWVQAAPWLNLLSPLLFLGMARALLGSLAPATLALAVFVLLNGARVSYDAVGGYTPWPATPMTALALFLGTLWLVRARSGTGRFADAMLIGVAAGMTGLAHLVPAVILACIIVAAAATTQGFRPRTLAWVILTGAVQAAVMAPYLMPTLLSSGLLNTTGGDWTHDLLAPHPRMMAKVAILNAPGFVAAALLWSFRREVPPNRLSTAILAVWVAVPALFLARHYACALLPVGGSGVCRAFVVPVHHWHLYLITAWAVMIGLAAWEVGRRRLSRADKQEVPWQRALAMVGAAGLLALGIAAMLIRPFDRNLRERSLLPANSAVIDAEAYRWILANTPPEAVFTTPDRDWSIFPVGKDGVTHGGPEAFTVIAAGRTLVAAPRAFSNPFAAWEPKDAMRRRVLEVVTGTGPADLPCAMVSAGLYAMLPVDDVVDRGRARVALRSAVHAIYQVTEEACADGLD